MQITDILHKEIDVFLLILLVICVYCDNHEKHCSQISVSTDIKEQIQ